MDEPKPLVREYKVVRGSPDKVMVPGFPPVFSFSEALYDIGVKLARPATVTDLMQAFLDGKALGFEGHGYTTISGIAYANEKLARFKIIPQSSDLMNLRELGLYTNIATATRRDTDISTYYEGMLAQEFLRKDLIIGRQLTEREALTDPVWRAAVPDQDLLEKFVYEAFKQAREEGRTTAMGIYLPDPDHPEDRPFYRPKEFKKGIPVIRPLSMQNTDLVDDSVMTRMCQMIAIIEGTREEVEKHEQVIEAIDRSTIVDPNRRPLFGEHFPD